MDLISIENHENTNLKSVEFQFNCFLIQNGDTPPHWHNHREILYIRDGSCFVYINGTVQLCRKGDIVLVPHGSLHSIVADNHAIYNAIVIGDTFFDSMLTDIHCKRTLHPFFSAVTQEPLHIRSTHSVYSSLIIPITTILDEEKYRKDCFEMMIKVELCIFFAELIRGFPERLKGETIQQDIVTIKMKKVIEYILKHFTEKISITDMAKYSHMSNQHFCRLFKAFTGKTFIVYLTDFRLEQSNKLLKTTDLPITRIPELTGFCNGNYFTRIYRNKYGFPPSHMRKKVKSNSDL